MSGRTPLEDSARDDVRMLSALRARTPRGALATAALVGATAALLLVDVSRTDQQRIDGIQRDLTTATILVGQDTLEPQRALTEFVADMETVLAAINGRSAYFSAEFTRLQDLFPDARALHVATSPGHTVATVGDPRLLATFERSEASSFCADGKGYAVVAAAIGSRGWAALALDPARALERARAGARQPVSLALVEAGAREAVADGRGVGCQPLARPLQDLAATGEYGTDIVGGAGGTTAVGSSPVLGTSLSVVIQDDARHHAIATAARRAAIVGLGALVWAAASAAWRLRSRRTAAR